MPFYTVNIPLVGQNINVTQQPINDNFTELFNFLGIDHVALNAANSGNHKAIHFEQVTDPSTTTSEVSLYNKLDTLSINRLFLREPNNGTIQQFTGQVTKAGAIGPPPTWSGQTMILGGIIVQWGNTSVAPGGTTINFTSTFPNACYGVVISFNDNAVQTTDRVVAKSPSTSNFFAQVNASTNRNCFWIALGN